MAFRISPMAFARSLTFRPNTSVAAAPPALSPLPLQLEFKEKAERNLVYTTGIVDLLPVFRNPAPAPPAAPTPPGPELSIWRYDTHLLRIGGPPIEYADQVKHETEKRGRDGRGRREAERQGREGKGSEGKGERWMDGWGEQEKNPGVVKLEKKMQVEVRSDLAGVVSLTPGQIWAPEGQEEEEGKEEDAEGEEKKVK
eukprot:756408-Hanusia_phi.AAC.1